MKSSSILLAFHAVACVEGLRGGLIGRLAHRYEVRGGDADGAQIPLTRTGGDGWYTAQLDISDNTSNVIVDTGSPWLWAYGSPNASSEQEAPSFVIKYMSARLGGVVTDQSVLFNNGGASPSAAAPGKSHCRVGRATEGDAFWIRQLSSAGVQGVLGLSCGTADSGEAMDAGTPAGQGLTLGVRCAAFASASANGVPAFSLQLRQSDGTLTFGTPPTELLAGLVQMPPSPLCGQWRAPLRVFMAGGNDREASSSDAVLDSAAVGIVGPMEKLAKIATKLGAGIDVREGSMVFTLPCSSSSSLPSVTFQFVGPSGEANVDLTGDDMVIPDTQKGSKDCRLIFAAWDSPQWLLGMPFFRAVRGVVFDANTQSVAIAPRDV